MTAREFIFDEMPDSRASTRQPPSYTLRYLASGEPNDFIVRGYAEGGSPAFVFTLDGILYRQDVKMDPAGYARYVVTIPYGPQQRDVGTFSFNFDTTGATVRVKAAKLHVTAFTASGEDGSDVHHGAIGVTNDLKVEGTDVVIPALKVAYTFKHPAGIVDEPFAMRLARATGKFNLNAWRYFDAGEALFVGATGSGSSDAAAEVTYNVVGSENADGDLTIGGIMDIVKQGHDYAWVEFSDEQVDGQPAVQPIRVNIERVYDPIDFEETFGWS